MSLSTRSYLDENSGRLDLGQSGIGLFINERPINRHFLIPS